MAETIDLRTIKELAEEVLRVQDACNLSGIIHSWSKSIRRLRLVETFENTDAVNKHPINVLFAGKVAQLTGCNYDAATSYLAYLECERLASERTTK